MTAIARNPLRAQLTDHCRGYFFLVYFVASVWLGNERLAASEDHSLQ